MKKLLAFLVIISVLFFVVPLVPLALAAEIRGANNSQVRAGETINDDLYISGTAVDIAGTVNGDVVAAGSTVSVSGHITGNLFAFGQTVNISGSVEQGLFVAGQSVTVSGDVTHTVRMAGQSIFVRGRVGRDLLAAGQTLALQEGSSVGQDLFVAAQSARILGPVGRSLQGSVESLEIGSRVGVVNVEAQKVLVTPGGTVGSLTYTSARDAEIQPGAEVGATSRLQPAPRPQRAAPVWTDQIVPRLWWFLSTLVLGVVAAWLVPALVREPAEALLETPWHSLGWGAVLFVVTPVAAVIAMITFVGIPLGLVLLFGYSLALFLSQVFVGLVIGRLILGQRLSWSPSAMIGPMALGIAVLMVALTVVGLIPFVGGLATLATLIFGLGSAWIAAGRARLGPSTA